MWAHLLRRPSHAAVLLLCVAVVVAHQLYHRHFLIDDAGIVFAYARNLAAGEGVVPWPGGERIEGISDPTWLLLLAAFEWIGVPSIVVAKPLAALFSGLTVPVVWRLAQLAMPDHDGPAPLFAPMALAASAQFAIWGASGLENALWCWLLAVAVLATVTDGPHGRFLRSSVAWLLVAWTRPEGLLYATCGAFWFLVLSTQRRQPLGAFLRWMVVFWAPTFALELARLWYFAWPLPNTWYAKLDVRATYPFTWEQRGWYQVREFGTRLWQVYYLPVYAIGLLSLRGWGGRIAVVTIALWTALLLYPTPAHIAALPLWPELPAPPAGWVTARLGLLVVTVVVLPFGALRTPGWAVRTLCWHTAGIAVLFSVYANGDWMGGYRWMSLMVPSTAVLLAAGVREIAVVAEQIVSGRPAWGSTAWTVAAFGVCALIPPNYAQSRDHRYFNADETVDRLRLRAAFTGSILERTFHERLPPGSPVNNLEMDMGGTLLYRPEYVQIDMAGLVDVPMSRHTYGQRAFIEEYVFGEHRPTFAHVHHWWAQFSGFPTYPQWADYVPLPAHEDIPPAPALHDGMWGHRSLFAAEAWGGRPRRVAFAGGMALEGVEVPAELWAEHGAGFVELGFTSPPRALDDVPHAIVFLTDGARVVASWSLELGYGLFGVEHWRDDVVLGRYALRLAGDVPRGKYDLGVVLLDGDGAVVPVEGAVPSGAAVGGRDAPAVLASGEVRFARMVNVVAPPLVEALGDTVRDEVLTLAEAGNCEGAEVRWLDAKRVRLRDVAWHDSQLRREVGPRIGECWASRAEGDPEGAPALLARAYAWDRGGATLHRVGAWVGARLWEEGKAARAAGDWETAYRRFEGLLGFQPWRSWARRYAEEARDQRLGLERGAAPQEVPVRPGMGPAVPLPLD